MARFMLLALASIALVQVQSLWIRAALELTQNNAPKEGEPPIDVEEAAKKMKQEDDLDPSDGGADSPNSPVANEKMKQDSDNVDPSDGGADSPNSPVANEKGNDVAKQPGQKQVSQDDENGPSDGAPDPSDGGADSPNSPVIHVDEVADGIGSTVQGVPQQDEIGQDETGEEPIEIDDEQKEATDLSYQDAIEIPDGSASYPQEDTQKAQAVESKDEIKPVEDKDKPENVIEHKASIREHKISGQPEASPSHHDSQAATSEVAEVDKEKDEAKMEEDHVDQKTAGSAPPYVPNWIQARGPGSKNTFIQGILYSGGGDDLNQPAPDWIR